MDCLPTVIWHRMNQAQVEWMLTFRNRTSTRTSVRREMPKLRPLLPSSSTTRPIKTCLTIHDVAITTSTTSLEHTPVTIAPLVSLQHRTRVLNFSSHENLIICIQPIQDHLISLRGRATHSSQTSIDYSTLFLYCVFHQLFMLHAYWFLLFCSRTPRKLITPRRSNAGSGRFMTSQQQQSPMQSARSLSPAVPISSSPMRDNILVVYTMEGHSASVPLAKRVSAQELSLSDFKNKVFARKGQFR